MTERFGRGPWARLLVSAVLPDEGSSVAERGRVLVEEEAVQDLVVTAGAVAARVGDCDVTIGAEPGATADLDGDDALRAQATPSSKPPSKGARSRCSSST